MVASTRSRALTWDGCLNVRDLGGLPTEDGSETQSGRVIRSDNIGQLTAAGWRTLADHGVVRIVDLRWPEEIADDPPREVDTEVVNVSVLGPTLGEGHDFLKTLDAHVDQVDDIADHFAWSYVEFLERNRERFGQALGAIADAAGPVVIHCMGGKDRTGLVAALLLRLAGVGLDEIGRDYSLTEANLAERTARWLAGVQDEQRRRRIEKLSRTPASAMVRVIEEIERRYGFVEGYLTAGGTRPEQIDRLRTRLR